MNFTSRLFLAPSLGIAFLSLLTAQAARAQTILGSNGSYAVMAGSTVTINGPTTIVGDLGAANVAGTPGYTVSGTTGPMTLQNQTDFSKAFAGLAAMPGAIDLTGQNLGGLTLAPGVYKFTSTAQLTGMLTLDAQNQSGAFWVFQIGSSFTSAAGASVVFQNQTPGSVDHDGLFWQVGSTTFAGANSALEGNFLNGTTISLDSSVTLGHGRLFTGTGTITLDSDAINSIAASSGYSGGLTFDGGGNVIAAPGAIPEPATYALIGGIMMLAMAIWRQVRRAQVA